jgi:putative ABC transport system permease protein
MVSVLWRKLGRDLWRVRLQAFAIAAVIAIGVMMLVMMQGMVSSLDQTRNTYYEHYRLANVFAPLKRGPRHLLEQAAQLPGVTAVEGRVNAMALVDLPEVSVPLQAQLVSLPQRLNDLHLVAGRRIEQGAYREAILIEGFAKAHKLLPGDHISLLLNGRKQSFRIVGLAQAPEFLYTAAPGELVPDDARFAVLWLNEEALAAAFDLDGAFNELLLSVSPQQEIQAVLQGVDRLLESYGGLGAYSRDNHISNRFIDDEIKGLRASTSVVPPIFMLVAAFLLYIVMSRMVQSEREQIGLLKAFGYSNREVGLHYLSFALVIAVFGASIGCLLGIYSGQAMAGVYQQYYKFPFLLFEADAAAILSGYAVSILAALAGGLSVLRRIQRLTPAVAMRPPAPLDFSKGVRFGPWMQNVLDQPTRMVLRGLTRQPGRAISAALGVAAALALSTAMLNTLRGFDLAMTLNYEYINRSDASVSFVEPISSSSLLALKRMDGIFDAEPVRHVSVTFRNGAKLYRGAITGLQNGGELYRALTPEKRAIYLRSDGIVLAQSLAEILDVRVGDTLLVSVHEGRRPQLEIAVAAVTDTLLGAPAYMTLSALNTILREPMRVNAAYLSVDESVAQTLYADFKHMPAVLGVSLRAQEIQAFKNMMDSGAGATRYIMAIMAGVITFGIVYNSARISFAERSRELASLRVLGMSMAEVSFILLGEIGLVTLAALPLGAVLGYYLSVAVSIGFSTDLYRIPAVFALDTFALSVLVVLLSAAVSGLLVNRDVYKLDLVSALKVRE